MVVTKPERSAAISAALGSGIGLGVRNAAPPPSAAPVLGRPLDSTRSLQ
jgi:hypothetical protein